MIGTFAENAIQDILTRRAQGTVRFGRVVEVGTDPAVQVKEYAGGGRAFGVALYDPTKGSGPTPTGGLVRQYEDGDVMAVARKGIISVLAGPTSGTIVPGMRLAVLQTETVLPSTKVTLADKGSGTSPCDWGATVKVAYTAVGEWGESALLGISDSYSCATTNATVITIPGKTACPLGTMYIRIYVSKDDGTTWANWPTGNIAYADLAAGATGTVEANAANDDLGVLVPPVATPKMPVMGDVLRSNDTRGILVITGTEVIKGGTAGQEILVQLNLPA